MPIADTSLEMKRFTSTIPLQDVPDRPKTPVVRATYFDASPPEPGATAPLEFVAANAYKTAEIHCNGGIQRWGLND